MLETLKEKWNTILLYLKEKHEISNVSYQTWLLPLEVYSTNAEGTVQIIVPDVKFSGYMKRKYGSLLKTAIEEITGLKCGLEFIGADQVKDGTGPNGQRI